MAKNKPKTKAKGDSGAERESVRPAAKKSVPPPSRRSTPPSARSATGKSAPPAKNGDKSARAASATGGRRFGMRGAAPWAVRHAERQAAEAARRNQEPPKPGSARATLRTPEEADRIKAEIGELHGLLGKLRSLQKNLNESFFELGELLSGIEARKLYEAKGYTSFESFVEREAALSKTMAQKLALIPSVFQRDAARKFRLDALLRAVEVLNDPDASANAPRAPKLPMKPPKS